MHRDINEKIFDYFYQTLKYEWFLNVDSSYIGTDGNYRFRIFGFVNIQGYPTIEIWQSFFSIYGGCLMIPYRMSNLFFKPITADIRYPESRVIFRE